MAEGERGAAARWSGAVTGRLLDLAADLACVVGYDGCFLELSAGWTDLLASSCEELVGRSLIEFVHPDHVDAVRQQLETARSGGDIVHFECRLEAADGTSRWLRSTAVAMPDEQRIYLVDQIAARPNIEVRCETVVQEVCGDDRLERVVIEQRGVGLEKLDATAMFIFIGASPNTSWLPPQVARDERGFVLTGPALGERRFTTSNGDRDPFLYETSVPGVFAVGDLRSRSVKRVASAVGEGSVAVQFVHEYLRS